MMTSHNHNNHNNNNNNKPQQFLHELLKQDQEPFKLKSYISDKRSKLILNKKSHNTLHINKNPSKPTKNLCKHACFFSFQNSPDVKNSPFPNFPSPVNKTPPNGAVFLHIPSRTASLLVEAAMRIQKQQKQIPKSKSQTRSFGLFGSLLKRLKDRNKGKKRVTGNSDFNVKKLEEKLEHEEEENVRVSCSCNSDFDLMEPRYCFSPFRFSLHDDKSASSSSGSITPDFCSPTASPCRQVVQEKESYEPRNSDVVLAEEEKKQCSPVSVLDPPFEEDDEYENRDAEEEDYDHESCYANVQRAKQQLLNRLRRFERLAEMDPMELEKKLLEGSDDEYLEEREQSDKDEPLALNETMDQYNSRKLSTDMKRLVSDLLVEEKTEERICMGNTEVVLGRVWNRLDSWKQVEFDTIDMMIELDFKRGSECVWKKFPDQVNEVVAEMEIEIYGLLMEELSEEMCNSMDGEY